MMKKLEKMIRCPECRKEVVCSTCYFYLKSKKFIDYGVCIVFSSDPQVAKDCGFFCDEWICANCNYCLEEGDYE